MRNAGLEEAQAGIKIARRNINNLRHADDTPLMAESEKVKVKSLSCVQLFATPWNVAHHSVHGILQARILEWVARILEYFGHLMGRVDSLEKTLMLGGIGGRK